MAIYCPIETEICVLNIIRNWFTKSKQKKTPQIPLSMIRAIKPTKKMVFNDI